MLRQVRGYRISLFSADPTVSPTPLQERLALKAQLGFPLLLQPAALLQRSCFLPSGNYFFGDDGRIVLCEEGKARSLRNVEMLLTGGNRATAS